jgi:spore coat protein U-like protein
VYALLPAGQDVAVGPYQDVVTVTILVVPKK